MGLPFDNINELIDEAFHRIRPHVRHTPLDYSPVLSDDCDASVYLKCENFQLSGSFKIRGVINSILSLDKSQQKRHIITASSGNHGSAFSYAAWKFGLEATVFLPENVSSIKLQALEQWNAQLRLVGTDCVVAENAARRFAREQNLIYISPYNDIQVIAGQGTIGVELLQDLPELDVILVPVGGGGLISGIAGYIKSQLPSCQIIGCQPENSAVMYHSIKAGKIVDLPSLPTLSDGTAGGIEEGAITFDFCRRFVDDFILVSEEEIARAVRFLLERHFMLVEGAGALTVAALHRNPERFSGKTVVAVISGSKIPVSTLRTILDRG